MIGEIWKKLLHKARAVDKQEKIDTIRDMLEHDRDENDNSSNPNVTLRKDYEFALGVVIGMRFDSRVDSENFASVLRERLCGIPLRDKYWKVANL